MRLNSSWRVREKMPVAFVLSGGGSLGAVQVGMLRALYERGIVPDLPRYRSRFGIPAVAIAVMAAVDAWSERVRIRAKVPRRSDYTCATLCRACRAQREPGSPDSPRAQLC
jgi:hypothetical protein